ncbi:MAG TPA: carbohydrate ABC transporter permease [Candidatus Limnocylindrales bacterium]|nr:carbohydrate ABC transporter permease [Candidatus Limnocylindrales bacterium]
MATTRDNMGRAVAAPVSTSAAMRREEAQPGQRAITPGRVVFIVALIGVSIVFLYPFVWLVSASLKTRETVFNNQLIPDPAHWGNYGEIWSRAPIAEWLFNSVTVSILAAVTVTLTSALVAFGFAYFRFPFRNVLFGLVLASMMLPGAVMMVPQFLIWKTVGEVAPPLGLNTLTPLWAMNLFGSAFYIFLLRQFFLGLPREVFEAARVDGANYFTMWRKIAIPLTLPALIVVFIFELKASWTDLMKPLIYIRDINLFTLPRGLQLLVSQFDITAGGEGEMQLLMAAAVIVTLPMIVVFFLGQRYFVEGIATTGRKG